MIRQAKKILTNVVTYGNKPGLDFIEDQDAQQLKTLEEKLQKKLGALMDLD